MREARRSEESERGQCARTDRRGRPPATSTSTSCFCPIPCHLSLRQGSFPTSSVHGTRNNQSTITNTIRIGLGWAMRSMTMHADVDNHASLGLVGLDRQVLPTSDTASPHAFPAFVFVRSLPRSPAERAFLVPNTTAR